MKTKFIAITVMALFIVTPTIFAQPPGDTPTLEGKMGPWHPRMMMKGEMGMKGCLNGIDLPEGKKAEFEKAQLEHQKVMVEHRANLAKLNADLKLAMAADKPDQKKIDKLAADIGKMKETQIKTRAAHIAKLRAMLPPDQQVRFDQNILKGNVGKKGKGMKGGNCGGSGCGGPGFGGPGGPCRN